MKITSLPASFDTIPFEDVNKAKLIGRNFPDFMIIGPQRTGTTWLNRFLRQHPSVHMSTPKEPHYFNNLITPVTFKEVSKSLDWYLSLFDVTFKKRKRLLKVFLRGNTGSLRIIRGEATASSAVGLPLEYIRFLYDMNPDIRIICGVRDPVERAWSALKLLYDIRQNRDMASVTLDEMFAFYESEYVISCGMATEYIAKWRSVIPAKQFYVLDHAQLTNDPVGTFLEVLHFLGVGEPSDILKEKIGEKGKVNPSVESPMPPEIRTHLENIYHDERIRLKNLNFHST